MTASSQTLIDFERLLRLRLVVGRHGEMDGAKWWNTGGLLGRKGSPLMSRGFPKTHAFAQARVVFSVARARCAELFSPADCMTLWNLPASVEDQFDARWQDWLDEGDGWAEFFETLQEPPSTDLIATLRDFDLLSDAHASSVAKLRRSAQGRAVPLPGTWAVNDEAVTLLAAAFSRGEVGNPAIPYARLEP